MTICDATQQALVSGEPIDREHVTSCAHCRALEDAHRAALGLAGVEPRRAHRPRRLAVLARAGLVLVTLTVGATVALGRRADRASDASVQVPTTFARGETELRAEANDHEREWAALVQLHQGLSTDLHRDLVSSDHTYSSFGALSQWLAPTAVTVTALED